MRAVEALERLGGVATTEALLAVTTRSRLRAAVGDGLVVRDARGTYALAGADEALRAAARVNGVLVEDSAAVFHGWEVLHRPRVPVVAVPRRRALTPDRRRGVRVRYRDLEQHEVSGRATTPSATVVQCAARLPFADALAIADSALRRLDVGSAGLVRLAEDMPLRHRSRCLRVVQLADGRAANPFESALRAHAIDAGLEVEPQVWIGEVGRADLADRERRLAIEGDSFQFHGHRRALKRDCERYNAFALEGWTVLRFAWEHAVLAPDYVRAVLRGMATGRPVPRALEPNRAPRSA